MPIRSCYLALLLASGLSCAADVEKSPTPDWVTQVPLGTTHPPDAELTGEDLYYHLVNYQTLADDEITVYRRIAYELRTREALNDHSSLSFLFAPDDQKLEVHHLRVLRDGEVQDRLPDQEIRMLQREGSLERNLYDGRMSAHILLEDIRVGDVIDYAYSVRGVNPSLGRRFFDVFALEYTRPVARMMIRHVNANDRPFHHRAHLSQVTPEIRTTSKGREYVWELGGLKGTRHEPGTPMWHYVYPTLEMGEFADWAEVVEWALPLYDFNQPLPAELLEIAENWRALPEKERIAEALRLVQTELRYVAMALGPHSYQPYPLAKIWARKFGDCKDKALLLVALLRHAGIHEAWPALVETDYGPTLERTLPSPIAFDHVMVHVRHSGIDYWLEPTAARQEGPLEKIFTRDHGHALVIRQGETGLKRMHGQGYEHARTEVDEHFVVQKYGDDATLQVETRYFGAEADRVRAEFQSNAIEKTADSYVSFYRKTYPNLRQLAPPATADDPAANVFTVRESYAIGEFFTREDGGDPFQCVLRASIMDDSRTQTGNLERKSPHELHHPNHLVQTLRLTLPSGGTFDDEDVKLDHPSATYNQQVRYADGVLSIRHEYRTLRDHIATEDIGSFREMMKQIYQHTDYPVSVPANHFGEQAVEQETPMQTEPESPTPQPTSWFALALGIIGTTGFFVGLLLAAALVFYPFGASWRVPAPALQAPTGLGGWLIVLGIGVVAGPIIYLVNLVQIFQDIDLQAMAQLADSEDDPHAVWWCVLVCLELTFAAFVVPVAVASLVLFLGRRRLFPGTHIALMVSTLVVAGVSNLGVYLLDPGMMEDDTVRVLTRSVIYCAIWSTYLVVSRRVRNTFVRIPGRPVRSSPPPLPGLPPHSPSPRASA